MKKLVLVPILGFALAACADRPAMLSVDADVAYNESIAESPVYFTSDAPDPGYVGDTYIAEAESSGEPPNWPVYIYTETPSTCSIGFQDWSPVTVYLEAEGTCRLKAVCYDWDCTESASGEAFQEFAVVEPLGSPRAPVTPRVPPRGRP